MTNNPASLTPTRENLKFLLWGDIVAIVILLILSIGIMIFPSVECFFYKSYWHRKQT